MRDLQSARAMWAKAVLFVLIGTISVVLILLGLPDWKIALLLALAIWSFCRAYFFAFYVIEKYIDPTFRYSGLFSMIRYLWEQRRSRP